LFYLPKLHNTEDFLAPVSAQQCDYITENYLALADSTNEYQEYFQHAFHAVGLSNLQTWREALDLYRNLYTYASVVDYFSVRHTCPECKMLGV